MKPDPQSKAHFKARVMNIIPRLSLLNLTELEWDELLSSSISDQTTKLTRFYILTSLSKMKELPYEALLDSLSIPKEEILTRSAKHFPVTQAHSSAPKKRRFQSHVEDTKENPLILENTQSSIPFHSPMRQLNVRVEKLEPATPKCGHLDLHEKTTPGKTVVYCFFSNSAGSLFKKRTPRGPKGMVNITEASLSKIEHDLPKLICARREPVSFEATLAKLMSRHGMRRRVGQFALTKATCKEVFKAHGVEVKLQSHGSEYHWSHLIAHFLGGDQTAENLVPGTASSNYMTLELVEKFIAEKLSNTKIKSIGICVKPFYSGESLIPDQLIFNLHWKESGVDQTEQIIINPRSHRPVTKPIARTLQFLRDQASPPEEDPQPLGIFPPPY